MKQILIIIIGVFNICIGFTQVFDVEAIKVSGANDKRINLVILSDGYQTNELDQFITDATSFTNTMFSESPFSEYINYFNVYAIKVPSNDSGADHPGTATDVTEPASPIKSADTYFNATYDSFDLHRLLYYEIDGNSANNTQAIISNVLANNFPTYDQALILVNSPEYGGSGGQFPMAYNGFWGAKVVIHEIGHSLFDLKDEYYPGDILAAEAINMTKETDPNSIKWKNWLNVNNIGIYQYTCNTGNCAEWYKPHQNCIMESIDKSFCSVCKEGIIEKIHDIISPIDSYVPISNSITNPSFPVNFQLNVIEPIPNTLENEWTLNGTNFASNVNTIDILETHLNTGTNNLTVVIHDNSPLLKVDNHDSFHISTITWSIENSSLGIKDITSEANTLNISLFPNPSNTTINFKIDSKQKTNLKVELLTLDGKRLKRIKLSNLEVNQVDIRNLNQGIYLANFYANNTLIASKKVVKN